MFTALGLIALAVGYKVFVDAFKEKEGVKLLGQVIGLVVMLGALAVILCSAMHCMTKKMNCSMMSKMNCPISAKAGYSASS